MLPLLLFHHQLCCVHACTCTCVRPSICCDRLQCSWWGPHLQSPKHCCNEAWSMAVTFLNTKVDLCSWRLQTRNSGCFVTAVERRVFVQSPTTKMWRTSFESLLKAFLSCWLACVHLSVCLLVHCLHAYCEIICDKRKREAYCLCTVLVETCHLGKVSQQCLKLRKCA